MRNLTIRLIRPTRIGSVSCSQGMLLTLPVLEGHRLINEGWAAVADHETAVVQPEEIRARRGRPRKHVIPSEPTDAYSDDMHIPERGTLN